MLQYARRLALLLSIRDSLALIPMATVVACTSGNQPFRADQLLANSKEAKMPKSSNPCPAQCSGGRHDRQHDVAPSVLESAGITDDWINRAARCGYCQLFYSKETPGLRVPRGHFEGNELWTAENWRPYLG